MITLGRSTSIFFLVHSWSLLKKTDFRLPRPRKRLYLSIKMFNNLIKQNLDEAKFNGTGFASFQSTESIKILSKYRKFQAIKKSPWKKEHFAEHFAVCAFFIELQCLNNYLVDYIRIINVYQFFFTLNILFDKADSREVKTRKKIFC